MQIDLSVKKRDQKALEKKEGGKDEGSFDNFPQITRKSVQLLEERGFKGLLPIQSSTFDVIFGGRDLIARDLTGSGKTLGFALPIVEHMRKEKLFGREHPRAVMLAPTRELAVQVRLNSLEITAELEKLKHHTDEYQVLTVYGGVPIDAQIHRLSKGVDIFVGTTGRVLDHLNRGTLSLKSLQTIVLDEADQMLKLGFKEDIEKVSCF